MTDGFALQSNRLCSTVPTQVAALSKGMEEWWVTTGNLIGSQCPVDTGGDDEVRFDIDNPGFDSLTSAMIVAVTLVSMATVVGVAALLYWLLLRIRRCKCLAALFNYPESVEGSEGPDESMLASEYAHEYFELSAGHWDESITLSDDGSHADTDLQEQLDPLYVGHFITANTIHPHHNFHQRHFRTPTRAKTVRRLPPTNYPPHTTATSHRYSSWMNSSAQLWVLDERLRVVVWSRGLTRICGFDPSAGTPLASFPFVSDEKRARMIRSLKRLDPRKEPMLPVYALVSLRN